MQPTLLSAAATPTAALIAALPLLLAATLYARRLRTLSSRGVTPEIWRPLAFAAGLTAFAVAILSPLEMAADRRVFAHMLQHLLILDLAPVLIVLGASGPILAPLLRASSRVGGRLGGRVRWQRLVARLTHPGFTLPLWILNLAAWHIPAVYQAATFDSEVLHALEHSMFFATGTLIWLTLLGPLPRPAWFGKGAALIFVAVIRLSGAVLGNVLMWSGSVLYPRYGPAEAAHRVDPLADQGAAGVVMMAESTVVILAAMVWLFFRWAAEDTERQRLLDLARSEGVSLDPARAARAAAAGQSERLAKRIQK